MCCCLLFYSFAEIVEEPHVDLTGDSQDKKEKKKATVRTKQRNAKKQREEEMLAALNTEEDEEGLMDVKGNRPYFNWHHDTTLSGPI